MNLKHNPNVNDTREHDFMLAVGDLGRKEGAGQDSRPALALRCVEGAAEGFIEPDDAANIWQKFQSEKQSKINPDLDWQVAPSENVQISKLKAFLKMGVLALSANRLDPVGTMDRSCKLLLEGVAAGQKSAGSKFDTLLKVARAQQDKDNHTTDMDDDALRAILFPEKEDADEEKLVRAAIKAAERADKAFPGEHNAIAMGALNARLADIISFKEASEMAAKGYVKAAGVPGAQATRHTQEPAHSRQYELEHGLGDPPTDEELGETGDAHEGNAGIWAALDARTANVGGQQLLAAE